MREIKFRAWDGHNKKMWNSDEVVVWNNNIYINPKKKLESKIYGWSHSERLVMQLISNKDIAGVGVFDRDIITFEDNKETYFVIFDEEREEYVACDISYFNKDLEKAPKLSRYWWGTKGIGRPIVLGNIYENPELLETKKSS
ncbi:YopX family protein [Vagococcus carniphilus]|uniref:YopX family protein n=1 Tax=Vagococcus carniphilus TaxID=218144 RepID=UPI00288CC199|nr:YopX family protein [Vagococcus carniphilus]MDT2832291.1 YopX family protein [Vagococcus carniphilus]MDT2840714.1 YopX family protein [Vagococcus carniphilus]MDT2855674.1 YopX family protein [Vagococcus carniphilus]